MPNPSTLAAGSEIPVPTSADPTERVNRQACVGSMPDAKLLAAGLLNIANPVEYGAEEYLCAMKVLDDWGVPRDDGERTYTLVGRMMEMRESLRQVEAANERDACAKMLDGFGCCELCSIDHDEACYSVLAAKMRARGNP